MDAVWIIRRKGFWAALLGVCMLAAYAVVRFIPFSSSPSSPPNVRSSSSPHAPVESKIARDEYFFRMLRDPATNTIPPGIRQRELAYARFLPKYIAGAPRPVAGKALAGVPGFDWQEAGPFDVGGRTRALAVDVADSNTVIAGGISGGVWKSTDGGATWTLKTAMNTPLSVSWIAQDPRSEHTNTWYYVTGEFRGNSASDFSGGASLFGAGIYKSTDNGETWAFLNASADTNPTRHDTPFDFMTKVAVSPVTGTVFVASNGFGILRSTDGGNHFQLVLGSNGGHAWSDVAVTIPDGKLLAVVSEAASGGGQLTAPGVYRSTDDGVSWTNITPDAFPTDHERSVIAVAPSNPDVAYILTFTGNSDASGEDIRFFKVSSITNGVFGDRSGNLPDFGPPVGGMDTQQSYNMTVAVKPDDEHFVFIGGINLFRSRNGFLTRDEDKNETWVGGYNTANDVTPYPDQHPDQHVAFFNPQNPEVMWAGHDGGVSRAPNVGARPMAWEDKNQGYNVTQFYSVAIPAVAGDNRVVGGTQDNGSPFFDAGDPGAPSTDLSSGDGGFAYIGANFIYASSQQGRTLRVDPGTLAATRVDPAGPTGQLFIHPFAIDPADEEVMYYPDNDHFWRNDSLSFIPADNDTATLAGWDELENIGSGSGTLITALAVSTSNPSHRLYFGAFEDTDAPPNCSGSTAPTSPRTVRNSCIYRAWPAARISTASPSIPTTATKSWW